VTTLEVDQMREQILEEAWEVLVAERAQRLAGDFEAARKLQAARRRLLALAGASEVSILFLLEEVLEDAQRGAG
jgi:hypothetical protein